MYAKEIYGSSIPQKEEERSIRKGPWSSDEDSKLINYIAIHGEGGWEALSRNAGNHNQISWIVQKALPKLITFIPFLAVFYSHVTIFAID